MNSSKKIAAKRNKEQELQDVKVPEKRLGTPKGGFVGNVKPVILISICVVLILVLCIGVAVQQLKPKVVVTVDKTKITMNDMMFPIYEVESQYAQINQMYETQLGSSFWEQNYQGTSSDGLNTATTDVSNSVGLKQELLNKEVSYEILNQKALEGKYILTADEKEKAHKNADKAMKGLSFTQKLRLNITKSNMYSRFEKRALAQKFREAKQDELNKTIDEDTIIKDISKKDYRQYDIQYYSVTTTETDDEGNSGTVGSDKKSQLKEKIKKIAEKAKTEKDFTKLADKDDSEVEFNKEGKIIENTGWSYLSEDNLKKVKKMKNGEISDPIYDDTTGYYVVVKMIDNNSDAAYKDACDSAIENAQTQEFNTWYQEEEAKHKVKVNTDLWTDVTVGSVTTDIVTVEDLEKMNEDASSDDASSSK